MNCNGGIKRVICAFVVAMALVLGCGNPAQEHVVKGYSFSTQKQWDSAIIEYTKAIELDPKLAMAYNNRGNAFYNKT
jgi:tetratricopeptide (TPR) repeat protein